MSTLLHVPWRLAPLAYGWAEIANIVRHLPEGSATWRALHPDEAGWVTRQATAELLAGVLDAVVGVGHILACRWSEKGSRPKPPKPVDLPWRRNADKQSIGGGGIPVADFDAWYYSDE